MTIVLRDNEPDPLVADVQVLVWVTVGATGLALTWAAGCWLLRVPRPEWPAALFVLLAVAGLGAIAGIAAWVRWGEQLRVVVAQARLLATVTQLRRTLERAERKLKRDLERGR